MEQVEGQRGKGQVILRSQTAISPKDSYLRGYNGPTRLRETAKNAYESALCDDFGQARLP